jgi:hypothetical protein
MMRVEHDEIWLVKYSGWLSEFVVMDLFLKAQSNVLWFEL